MIRTAAFLALGCLGGALGWLAITPTYHDPRISTPSPSTLVQLIAQTCLKLSPALSAPSLSDNTRRAYRSDLAHFIAWGGTIPATDREIASYLAEHAGILAVATLLRRLSTISRAHEAKGVFNPTRTELVRATVSGIKRSLGTSQVEASPLTGDQLRKTLAHMGTGLKDKRDRALLLIGFAGGFRRSELVAINREDVENVRRGIVIHIRRSKTDQVAAGRKIGIPRGDMSRCPVRALANWLRAAEIQVGPLFRRVDRHGNVYAQRLSGEAVSLVLKQRVAACGLDPDRYSGHSLRAGFVTSAVRAGVSTFNIRKQTGHRSDSMIGRYVRDYELFADDRARVL